MLVARVSDHSSLQLVLVVDLDDRRQVRARRVHAREPRFEPCAPLHERQRAQVLALDRSAHRRGARGPETARAASCVTPLRLSRCCRSLNGATSPLRTTSSSPSSTALKLQSTHDVGKALRRCRRRCASRAAPRRPPPRSARGCRPISIRRRTRRGRAPPSPLSSSACDSISGRNTGALDTSGLGARPSSQANSGS